MKHDRESGRPTQFEPGDYFRIGNVVYVVGRTTAAELTRLLKTSPSDIPNDMRISIGRTVRPPGEEPTPFHPRVIFEAASIEPVHTRRSAEIVNIKREKSVILPQQNPPQRQIGL